MIYGFFLGYCDISPPSRMQSSPNFMARCSDFLPFPGHFMARSGLRLPCFAQKLPFFGLNLLFSSHIMAHCSDYVPFFTHFIANNGLRVPFFDKKLRRFGLNVPYFCLRVPCFLRFLLRFGGDLPRSRRYLLGNVEQQAFARGSVPCWGGKQACEGSFGVSRKHPILAVSCSANAYMLPSSNTLLI